MAVTEPVTAAGGVIYVDEKDAPRVLLIFRRGLWDLPKGKLEEGETVEQCAGREVAEEIGVSNRPVITHTLTDTYHEYEQNGIRYGKTTHWFAMQLKSVPPAGFEPETKEGIEKVKWVDLPEAKQLVGFDNLKKVLNALQQLHEQMLL